MTLSCKRDVDAALALRSRTCLCWVAGGERLNPSVSTSMRASSLVRRPMAKGGCGGGGGGCGGGDPAAAATTRIVNVKPHWSSDTVHSADAMTQAKGGERLNPGLTSS